MELFPEDIDLILVVILPKPRDFEIARLFGWYRIPLKTAPKVISVDYLAFYQTGAFGEKHRWQIESIAPVRGHELTKRKSLFKDEPDHPRANEEYFKIQIGEMIHLPHPIKADSWRRITFFYTTGALLRNASTLQELVVSGEERNTLWKSLRERANLDQKSYEEKDFQMDIDLDLLKYLQDWDTIKEPSDSFLDLE